MPAKRSQRKPVHITRRQQHVQSSETSCRGDRHTHQVQKPGFPRGGFFGLEQSSRVFCVIFTTPAATRGHNVVTVAAAAEAAAAASLTVAAALASAPIATADVMRSAAAFRILPGDVILRPEYRILRADVASLSR